MELVSAISKAGIVALYLAFTAGVAKYLWRDFYYKPGQLEQEYGKRRKDAVEAVSGTQFMPALAEVVAIVVGRMKISDAHQDDAMEFLVEADIQHRLRNVKAAAVAEDHIRSRFTAYVASCHPVWESGVVLWLVVSVSWPTAAFFWSSFVAGSPCFLSSIVVVAVCLVYSIRHHQACEQAFLEELRR